MRKGEYHEPVMVREVLEALHLNNKSKLFKNQARYIDATLGTAGHAIEIVKAGGVVLGIDEDPGMLAVAEKRLKEVYPERSRGTCPTPFKLFLGNFRNIVTIAKETGFEKVSGILFDLGVSNIHLKDLERGFSFENPDALLDMRLNPDMQGVTAADLLNSLREDQLRQLFGTTMSGFYAKRLAKRALQRRSAKPFTKVGDLLDLCRGIGGKPGLHPATLPFLALRIAVNSELENLKEALPGAFELLKNGGRLVVLSFHSGEDAIVKDYFIEKESEGKGKSLTDKPIRPDEVEVRSNPRARSARMRILERI